MDGNTIAVEGMRRGMDRVQVIAQNMVNLNTVGYRKIHSINGSFIDLMSRGQLTSLFAHSVEFGEITLSKYIDTRAGPLKFTGNPLDLAISGNGYFEIMTKSGSAYTRAGNFRRDPSGTLVTAQGHPLVGTHGRIVANGFGDVTVDEGGRVFQDEREIARISLVSFKNGTEFQELGNGLYFAPEGAIDNKELQISLQVGFLEGANVVMAKEMVDLMATIKHIEAMQKLLLTYDDATQKAIQKLGEF